MDFGDGDEWDLLGEGNEAKLNVTKGLREQPKMVGELDRPAGERSKAPGLDKTFKPGPPELAFPTTLAGAWPPCTASSIPAPPGNPATSGHEDLQQVHALGAVITSLTSLCQCAWRSMRSWESAPGPALFLAWAESQGRMDLIASLMGWRKEFVNRWVDGPSGLKTAVSRPRS